MAKQERREVPADMARGRDRFTVWRRTKKPRSRVRESLWKMAFQLAAKHGIHRTTRTLKLDYYSLKTVYRNDAVVLRKGMSAEERLQLHQAQSEPAMTSLSDWLHRQFDEKRVEPNSSLGGAIRYILNHWEKLPLKP